MSGESESKDKNLSYRLRWKAYWLPGYKLIGGNKNPTKTTTEKPVNLKHWNDQKDSLCLYHLTHTNGHSGEIHQDMVHFSVLHKNEKFEKAIMYDDSIMVLNDNDVYYCHDVHSFHNDAQSKKLANSVKLKLNLKNEPANSKEKNYKPLCDDHDAHNITALSSSKASSAENKTWNIYEMPLDVIYIYKALYPDKTKEIHVHPTWFVNAPCHFVCAENENVKKEGDFKLYKQIVSTRVNSEFKDKMIKNESEYSWYSLLDNRIMLVHPKEIAKGDDDDLNNSWTMKRVIQHIEWEKSSQNPKHCCDHRHWAERRSFTMQNVMQYLIRIDDNSKEDEKIEFHDYSPVKAWHGDKLFITSLYRIDWALRRLSFLSEHEDWKELLKLSRDHSTVKIEENKEIIPYDRRIMADQNYNLTQDFIMSLVHNCSVSKEINSYKPIVSYDIFYQDTGMLQLQDMLDAPVFRALRKEEKCWEFNDFKDICELTKMVLDDDNKTKENLYSDEMVYFAFRELFNGNDIDAFAAADKDKEKRLNAWKDVLVSSVPDSETIENKNYYTARVTDVVKWLTQGLFFSKKT